MEAFLAQHSLSASTYTSSLCELIIPGGLILPDKREKGKKKHLLFLWLLQRPNTWLY